MARGSLWLRHSWMIPFVALEWGWEWFAYWLSNWKLLEVLEYMSSLSVLVAVTFCFSESSDRLRQKHLINTAQGKGGSGGRLEELNKDGVPLAGVGVSGAFLQDIKSGWSALVAGEFQLSRLARQRFCLADFSDADLRSANFRGANLTKAYFHGTKSERRGSAQRQSRGSEFSWRKSGRGRFERSELSGCSVARNCRYQERDD